MTLIERIKEEIEDRIKEANQYAYLNKQYYLATHMEENREEEAITRLSRIGFDNCLGYISYDNSTNLELYHETNSLESIDPEIFIKNNSNSKILDVRTKNEYNNGSFKDAINIPLNKIHSDLSCSKDEKLQLFCAGGYRSVIACSILLKSGYKNLVNVEKGYLGIIKLIS